MGILEKIKNAKPIDKEVLRQSRDYMKKVIKTMDRDSKIREARSCENAKKTIITGIVID